MNYNIIYKTNYIEDAVVVVSLDCGDGVWEHDIHLFVVAATQVRAINLYG